ncbi:FeoB-associated Cys-rich membrane protein [Clostridiaceae bacterium 68-1-5]|uniref:FeoB-associated Cys-rich membrane protein n=1 Tax=Suipraeoptans intestinalis TaxID=2606628 RepID=A0A6N7US89_9FIRM|nr:FeoB-associated Cys-rich membrane protein [Suipraeoptans intestinalis]MSR93723.1 FeoB-associated Cys-rich membrane protein [Suipraeoptans intestinalis]
MALAASSVLSTGIIGGILTIAVIAIVRSIWKKKKSGGCCGDCGGGCCSCPSHTQEEEQE